MTEVHSSSHKISKDGHNFVHKSVLLSEAVDRLVLDSFVPLQKNTRKAKGIKDYLHRSRKCLSNGHFLDATFGRGGYTRELLRRGVQKITALDRDKDAISFGNHAFEKEIGEGRLTLYHAKFSDLDTFVEPDSLAGAVFDIGVSSPQLEDAERGFSFLKEGPLDMRMGLSKQTAADFLNAAREEEIAHVLWTFGGERKSRSIAKRIVAFRKKNPFKTTQDLVRLFGKAVQGRAARGGAIHPATRTFQALRILVNDELLELEVALKKVSKALSTCGRLVCVSFHSEEDRRIKHFFKPKKPEALSRHGPLAYKNAPTGDTSSGEDERKAEPTLVFETLEKQPLVPSREEVAANPRARSARLRWGVKWEGECDA